MLPSGNHEYLDKHYQEVVSRSVRGPVKERYRWVVEYPWGSQTVGGNLEGCTGFLLIPTVGDLPKHEVRGIKMKRRFLRHAVRVINPCNKTDETYHCVVCEGFRLWFRYSDGAVIVTGEEEEINP